MTRLTKTALAKTSTPLKETLMDKTTRVVREILDDETAQRQARTLRQRKARLEREAAAPPEAPSATKKTPRARKPVV